MHQIRLIRHVRLGIKTLLLHKMRSLLTMLGVVFGVGSVIAMLSVGEGASRQALDQIRKLGSTNIIIDAMKPVDEETQTQRIMLSVYGLTYADELRVRSSFPTVERVVPAKLLRREGRLNATAMDLRLVGTTPEWFSLVQRPLIAGRVMTQQDIDQVGAVVVLTETGARRLLAGQEVIGQNIAIGGQAFQVAGIIKSEAGTAGSDFQTPDESVDAYIPIALARERFGDINFKRTAGGQEREMVELHKMIVQVRDQKDVETTAAAVTRMLETFHKKKDYKISVPLTLLRQAESQQRIWNWTLGSIAGISLLVGGIGIMNIMLASVTERIREIGIRRAIGAKKRQIVGQFLIETVVLSVVGGFIGTVAGPTMAIIIRQLSGIPTVVPLYSIILSVGISVTIGIVFGLYPAIRAANLDPIQALRHE